MKIKILESSELDSEQKKILDEFVCRNLLGSIHQLSNWGLFQIKTASRDQFWVIKIEDVSSGKIIGSALIIRQNLPFKKCWLYCPRGPLIDYSNQKITEALFEKIAELARQQNAIFFRFDPPILMPNEPVSGHNSNITSPGRNTAQSSPEKNMAHVVKIPFSRPAHAHYQPESTLIIDLKPEPNLILAQMKPKGRYNIKVAQKHNVKIRIGSEKDLPEFYNLLTQTTTRDNFSGHPLNYYKNMLSVLGPEQAKLYLAEYTPPDHQGLSDHHEPIHTAPKILAAAIVTYFNHTATYYFGASSNEYRNTMAPYLLHWQIMLDAKKTGYKDYDLFGISPEQNTSSHKIGKFLIKPHPWASVTDFKLKFGGNRVNYFPAQEIVYKPFWYKVIRITKFLKRTFKLHR